MTDQLDMFGAKGTLVVPPRKPEAAPPAPPAPPPAKPRTITPARKLATIAERFEAFHAAHPEVYAEMRRLALEAVAAGKKRLGAKALAERVRWELGLRKPEGEEFAVNNSYVAMLSRMLQEREPALRDVFETRTRKAA